MTSPRGKRLAGLSCLLTGIGLVVAARAAVGKPAGHEVALMPAAAPPAASTTTVVPPAGGASGAAPPPRPTTAAPPVAPQSGPRTVQGSVVDTPYGSVQVAVVFNGSRITDVQAIQTPDMDNRSVRLAELATPILRQEVLQAQSAQVDTVSGATYTSEGYAQSVQYALDHR